MTTNIFITNPLKIVILDPLTNVNKRTFIMLGDVPKGVFNACYYYNTVTVGQRSAYDKLLKEFYGTDYKSKLGLDIKNYSTAWIHAPEVIEFVGSNDTNDKDPLTQNELLESKTTYDETEEVTELLGGSIDDEIDISDIEELLNAPTVGETAPAKAAKLITSSVSSEELRAEFDSGIEYITDIHVYPEDKFNELKEKIYLTTNIPAYRQHLFYIDRNRLQTIYKIYAEGIYNVDIRRIAQTKDNIYGVPIDKFLYDIRENVRIEALDMFKVLGESLSFDNVVYVVDLAQFTHKIQTQLMDMINDTYQFELFYYGFVIKYWPQLTQECFYDYVRNEPELQHKYPDLAKNKTTLYSVHKAEKDIVDYNYRNMNKALSYAENTGLTIAITQMVAVISGNRVMLNIRNLFDKLRVTRVIPEIHAYIEYNNKRYMLRKRHIRNGSDIQFPSGMLMKTGITIAISLRKSDQESFHARSTISTMENEQSRYLFLNIHPNGKYYIRTIWNEEDELGFDEIIKIMKKFTDPIIHGINNLGRYVFIAGNELPIITKQNVNYQSLNICLFWKKVMLESTFKIIRSLWESYMRARITGIRNVQQFDKYEFLFRKGMYEFDTTAIERIVTASNNIILSNYYAHLSNNTIKQKWDQNYDGRIVRMSHRTTDVRFEVSDIREREFQTFYRYIITFVYRTINDERVKAALNSSRSYKDVKKLRKLREQDPELYNLKKYGSKKVYSIICQNQRQPLIYTPDELKNMSQQEIKKLTQYWNFTLNKPAFYGCPNRKYPHLSFMVGAHPKHYCLPCCNKKSQQAEESKKNKVNTVCLQKHKYEETDISGEAGISRHVMNYGKDIDLGRLSKLPQTSIKNLLFNTLNDTKFNYYIYGVAQHIPGIENIGIIYSVAEALDISMEELIKNLLHALNKPGAKSLFNTLLNGTLSEYFRTMDDLLVTIKELFLNMKIFTKEIQKFKQWSELFMELFHIIFKISIFTFIDETGYGNNIDLFVPDILKNEILYVSKLAADDKKASTDLQNTSLVSSLLSEQKYILIIKRQNRFYPIFVVDVETYFKTYEVESRNYIYEDKVIQLLYSMIKYDARSDDLSIEKRIDLSIIKEFTTKNPDYKIIKKFANRQNLCYAVIIESLDGQVYIPINYSVYISDNIEVNFDAFSRNDYNLTYATLKKFIDKFNAFIHKNYSVGETNELFSYKLIQPSQYIGIEGKETVTNGLIGLISDNMIFYFNKYSDSELDTKLPIKVVKYDYNEINKLILQRTAPVEDNRSKKLGEALYDNYLYQLFLIEFINYLDNERNIQIRSKIKTLITETNFKKDVARFRKEIRDILKEYPNDFNLIQSQLIAFYHIHFNKNILIEYINSTVYDFDRVTMNKLKKLPHSQLKIELKKIAESFSEQKDFDSSGISFPNIYMPCSEMNEETGFCTNKKLIINKPIDDLIDILATDLMDDLKSKYLLNNLFMDNIQDYLVFTRYPTEILTIYRLSE
ncbi:hypothetical protein PV-S19_0231 [Pacmanvirus S19]|nr:hypothetical protein PV-S19_0231 [Pacmanvirus S19]